MLGVRRVREAISSESMAVQPAMKQGSPEQQLASFIASYTREIGSLAHEALAKMRALLPGAVELVYDNYMAYSSLLSSAAIRVFATFSTIARLTTRHFAIHGPPAAHHLRTTTHQSKCSRRTTTAAALYGLRT
jgi:hypothetical protein